MHLFELAARQPMPAATGVPDWLLGYFKRFGISFANGKTDLHTNVCWLQSRNFTIDLRLPKVSELVPHKKLKDYSAQEIQRLANYEGWAATCEWQGDTLSWLDTQACLQLHNRWTEPGILKRTGNCLIEFSPSNAYVEDWRLQPSQPGPLIGLRLVEERNSETGELRHADGGLIICGDYAGLVLGRAQTLPQDDAVDLTQPNALRQLAAKAVGNQEKLSALFNFETSVAKRNAQNDFEVILSTQAARVKQPLCSLDGFSWIEQPSSSPTHLKQSVLCDGVPCERMYAVDTMEPMLQFELATGFSPAAESWFNSEAQTLTRYTEVLN